MSASHQSPSEVEPEAAVGDLRAPARVYVRAELQGSVRTVLWGIEHGGRRCEVVEAWVPGRPAAAGAIERDLRRGVGFP